MGIGKYWGLGISKHNGYPQKKFYEETGVNLGRDIAQPLGEYLHGRGGGHITSAGVNGEGDLDDAFNQCLRLLHEKLADIFNRNVLTFIP